MDEELEKFLKDRGVSDSTLRKMKEDKVDRYVIESASDDILIRPGDCIAVKAFCTSPASSVTTPKRPRQNKILARLREKLLLKRGGSRSGKDGSEDSDDTQTEDMPKTSRQRLSRNTNAVKDSRKIEIGWLHYGDIGYAQVRKKKGGGTRKVDISKNANQHDILQKALSLFFVNEKSILGHFNDFEFKLTDFCETTMENSNETVGDMYDRTGMGILRFYMATKIKLDQTNQNSEPTITSNVKKPSSSNEILIGEQSYAEYMVDDDLPDLTSTENNTEVLPSLENSDLEVVFNTKPLNSSTYETEATSTPAPTIGDSDPYLHYYGDVQPNIPMSSQVASFIEIPDTSMYSDYQGPQPANHFELAIHRGAQGFSEMLGYFKDPNICKYNLTIVRVLSNGEKENAEDTGGVLRDLLADFWSDFYKKCTLGRAVKVPCLRHDFGCEEWKSVARILVYGWEHVGYWPTEISKAFMLKCLFQNDAQISDILFTDFGNFISKTDKEVFEKATEDINSVEGDELVDILDSHDYKIRVGSDNIRSTVLEIAHKEIIQMPMFVSDCLADIVRQTGILTPLKLESIYSSLIPSNKSVVKLLIFPDNPSSQISETMKHLKRYVKELDENKLRLFLRFCTGADLITVPKITVSFSDLTGLSRRPVSHTCGCVLEVPEKYENFMEFRSEFDGVLESNVWIMDIV